MKSLYLLLILVFTPMASKEEPIYLEHHETIYTEDQLDTLRLRIPFDFIEKAFNNNTDIYLTIPITVMVNEIPK